MENEEKVLDEEQVKSEEGKQDKPKKNNMKPILIVVLLLIIAGCFVSMFLKPKESEKVKTDNKTLKSDYRMEGNSLSSFDISFLQLENEAKNKVYSPISIKYALEMLSEGANGDTKAQLDAIIGDYKANKYTNDSHMSFANAMFIRNSFKDSVKKEYTDLLKDKYNAEVIFDSFKSPDNINKWVSNKTFKLIDKLIDKVDDDFFLINALAIDMNWNYQIHCTLDHKIPCLVEDYEIEYDHEKLDEKDEFNYDMTSYRYSGSTNDETFPSKKFNNKYNVQTSEVLADFNRYDILKEVGKDKIRKTVTAEYKKWLEKEKKENPDNYNSEYVEKDVNKYINNYIKEIGANYGKKNKNTDFLLYDDENVKAFAKDLKEDNGVTLQYVGIMPKKQELTSYIDNMKAEDVNEVIKNLKEVKYENFKDGVATKITGNIPFFDFEYQLKLLEDLKKMGVKDVFDPSKANLSNLSSADGVFVDKAIHKAKIEFSNDGIKAAAVTAVGGLGAAGGGFDYLYTVPTEKIDLSFDKPFMYVIRDKNSGEIWFAGTVYDPVKSSKEEGY